MTLADLQDGDRVFIDANIFIYHFGGRSRECQAFLERCARHVLSGYTSTPVLAEVLHRRMVAEAIAQGFVTARTAVRKLGETPEMVTRLTQYQDDVQHIPHMRIIILPLTLDIVRASAAVRKSEGLLTNDSLVVACMREQGLTRLATANGDFDRVSGMTIYKLPDPGSQTGTRHHSAIGYRDSLPGRSIAQVGSLFPAVGVPRQGRKRFPRNYPGAGGRQ